jgi:exonuclease 1
MGISGLLPVLKTITNAKHISAYRGQKVAVDGFSWLHKGAYACSRELCEGVYTDKCVAARGKPAAWPRHRHRDRQL